MRRLFVASLALISFASCETTKARRVAVPASLRSCKVDSDCRIVDEHCGGCCAYAGVRADRVKEFHELQQRECEKGGAVCECFSPLNAAACVSGRCEAVER